jgi:hypothetical protein
MSVSFFVELLSCWDLGDELVRDRLAGRRVSDVGDFGRVSANSEATLKLLILEFDFCCDGTVGLVMAIRNEVTVIPDDFIM